MDTRVIKGVAVFQMFTGVFMFLTIGYFLIEGDSSDSIPTIIHILFLLLYSGEAYAGKLLWQDKSLGITLSTVFQSLHLAAFDSPFLTFKFTDFVHFFIYYRLGEPFGFEATLGQVNYTLTFLSGSSSPMVALNIVALVLLVALIKAKKQFHTGLR